MILFVRSEDLQPTLRTVGIKSGRHYKSIYFINNIILIVKNWKQKEQIHLFQC